MITSQIFYGVVEDRNDYLNLGRCKVRVAGLHTHDKTMLPTCDLPWASVVQHGGTFFVPTEGTQVAVQFFDYPTCQIPVVVGTLPSIPQHHTVYANYYDDPAIVKTVAVPTGTTLPQNAQQNSSNNSLDDCTNIDVTNQKAQQQIEQASSGEQQAALVNGENIPNATGLGNVGASTYQQLGQSTPKPTETAIKIETTVASVHKAKAIVANTESCRRGSSLPAKLLSGETSLLNEQVKFNQNVAILQQKYGAEKADKMVKQMIVEQANLPKVQRVSTETDVLISQAATSYNLAKQEVESYSRFVNSDQYKAMNDQQKLQWEKQAKDRLRQLGVDPTSGASVKRSIADLLTKASSSLGKDLAYQSVAEKDSAEHRLRNNISGLGADLSAQFLQQKQIVDQKNQHKLINLQGAVYGTVGNIGGIGGVIGNAGDLITGSISSGIGGAIGGLTTGALNMIPGVEGMGRVVTSLIGSLIGESVKKFIKKKLDKLFQFVLDQVISMIGGMIETVAQAAGSIDTIVNTGYEILQNPSKALSSLCPTICSLLGFPPDVTNKVNQVVDKMVDNGCSFEDVLQMIFGTETESGTGPQIADAITDALSVAIKAIFATGMKPIELIKKITDKVEEVVNGPSVMVAVLALAMMTMNPSILNQHRLIADTIRSINGGIEKVLTSITSSRDKIIDKISKIVEDAVSGVFQSLNLMGAVVKKVVSLIPISTILNFVISNLMAMLGIKGEANIGISADVQGSMASSNTMTSETAKDIGSYSTFAKYGQNASGSARGVAAEGGTPGLNGRYGGPNSPFAQKVPQAIPTM